MIIGIDIDNTLTDVQEKINIAAFNYAKKLGKNIENSCNLAEEINNTAKFYRNKFKFSENELKYFLKNIQEEITNEAKPREGTVHVIQKLRNQGHKIYVITARDSEFHDDPYILSKNWLDKNNIEYDKLIVNARDKNVICKNENVDIFIDDQLHNCIAVSNANINCIRITNDTTEYDNITNLCDWNDIYNYIKEFENK